MSFGRSITPSGGQELPGPATSHGFHGLAPDVFVNVKLAGNDRAGTDGLRGVRRDVERRLADLDMVGGVI